MKLISDQGRLSSSSLPSRVWKLRFGLRTEVSGQLWGWRARVFLFQDLSRIACREFSKHGASSKAGGFRPQTPREWNFGTGSWCSESEARRSQSTCHSRQRSTLAPGEFLWWLSCLRFRHALQRCHHSKSFCHCSWRTFLRIERRPWLTSSRWLARTPVLTLGSLRFESSEAQAASPSKFAWMLPLIAAQNFLRLECWTLRVSSTKAAGSQCCHENQFSSWKRRRSGKSYHSRWLTSQWLRSGCPKRSTPLRSTRSLWSESKARNFHLCSESSHR